MFKKFLYFLDTPPEDDLLRRIEREPITAKYFMAIGGSIIMLLSVIVIGSLSIYIYKGREFTAPIAYSVKQLPSTKAVNEQGQEYMKPGSIEQNQIITLPQPHQSMKNVVTWLKDAMMNTYSFSFLNFDESVDKSSYYFTPDGYSSYKRALELAGVKDALQKNLMQISLVPISEPIMIIGGDIGDVQYWKFRTEVLINYTTGSQTKNAKYIVETTVESVPPYRSPKGLGISQYNVLTK